jgi:hypothetical protein
MATKIQRRLKLLEPSAPLLLENYPPLTGEESSDIERRARSGEAT